MKRLVQIRTYALKPGCGGAFDALFVERSLPMLTAAGIDVVAFGASPHDPDARYLIRAFDDLVQLNAEEDAFYASDAWRLGPRAAILDAIDRHLDALLWMSPDAIDDLRDGRAAACGSANARPGVTRRSPPDPA